MTLEMFQQKSQCEQVELLYQQGVYVGKRRADGLVRLLYQLDSFYVEITYTRYRCDILCVRSTASTRLIEPYLEQIDVELLVS